MIDTSNYKPNNYCPCCGATLVKIDDMNYFTLICPECYTTVFEEIDGKVHSIKNGIASDGYNVSLDIFYKQFMGHEMMLNGMFGKINPGEIILSRIFRRNIYDELIFKHFSPMIHDFTDRRPYMYFKGYSKYFKMSDKYTKETFPWFFN